MPWWSRRSPWCWRSRVRREESLFEEGKGEEKGRRRSRVREGKSLLACILEVRDLLAS